MAIETENPGWTADIAILDALENMGEGPVDIPALASHVLSLLINNDGGPPLTVNIVKTGNDDEGETRYDLELSGLEQCPERNRNRYKGCVDLCLGEFAGDILKLRPEEFGTDKEIVEGIQHVVHISAPVIIWDRDPAGLLS